MDWRRIDWLWHSRGSIVLDPLVVGERVIDSVEARFKAWRRPVFRLGTTEVSFAGPLRHDPLDLAMFDRGRFWIETGSDGTILRYELRSLYALAACAVAGLLFSLHDALIGDFVGALEGSAMIFVWAYGGVRLFSYLRLPEFLAQAISDS